MLIAKKFLKNINGQRKNKMETNKSKHELTVNCYAMSSTGNYVILPVFTVKLYLLKLWVIILIVL